MEEWAGFMGEEGREKTEYGCRALISALCVPVRTFREEIHPLSALIWPHSSLVGGSRAFLARYLNRELGASQGEYFTFLLNASRKGTWIWDEHKGVGLIASPAVISF